ncbi:MAG: 4Fe-4S dicluster domain-containing protein [Desulfobaccales bacterium]
MLDQSVPLLEASPALSERLAAALPVSVSACFQCKKCSGGCPLAFAMDLLPDQVIRLAILGQEEALLRCRTIWVCSACETCTTRCPNGIDIAGTMDWLKEEALKRGYASQPGVARFHQTFLETVRLGGGRLSEPLLLGLYQWRGGLTLEKIKSGALLNDLRLGWKLARRGRLVLKLPHRLKGAGDIKEIFARAKKRTRP